MTTDPALLATELDAVNEVDRPVELPNYNVAPTTEVLAVVSRHSREDPNDDAALRIRSMRWGLIPSWAKTEGDGPLLFNARAETAATKSAFRTSMQKRRCLVPMDGWFEWERGRGVDGKPVKKPFYMSPADRSRLFMAGLWTAWRPDADAPTLLSCSILTTDAVGPLRQVHDRMPLIMLPTQWDAWLNPDGPAPDGLLAPVAESVADAIEIRRVAPLVNNVANNGPRLLEPAEPEPEQGTLL